eukprot:CAMPEP_0196644316 /NCGR_PEP_ID=MMETSP1085-20130531/7058_1 /TAXON_ID=41879 ORGANISM="Pycnococcus sp, Strain CCMP1998" /NCGR_SAMPLE_ID=MMETSP1085 /ASSEMBLY_ACC=CAM_ASM_000807 /LENGTH=127 /DNA_ID=CAMNT_0041973865 /DNA_START=87 /DNA_END=467 /DNA_ORIENTATION=-
MTGVGIFVCLHISADDVHFDPLILSIYVSTLAGASAPLLRPPEFLLGPAEEGGQIGPPDSSALACPRVMAHRSVQYPPLRLLDLLDIPELGLHGDGNLRDPAAPVGLVARGLLGPVESLRQESVVFL